MTLFMLLEGPGWVERGYGLLPEAKQERWRPVGRDIYRTVGGYVNGNLLISLIAGILGLTFFPVVGSIIAVVTASMAKKEILQSAGRLGGEGMATAGQVLGWIGIALGAIGLCVGGFIVALPFCLGFFAILNNSSSSLLPGLLALL